MRHLFSPKAIVWHIFCIAFIAILISDLLSDQTTRPKSELIWAIIIIAVAYPLVPTLFRLGRLLERREMQNQIKNPTPPGVKRNQRKRWRKMSLVYIYCIGFALIYAGYKGWTIDFLPAQYLGFFLIAFGVLGTSGVNIWYKGPIDPGFDPKEADTGQDEAPAHEQHKR